MLEGTVKEQVNIKHSTRIDAFVIYEIHIMRMYIQYVVYNVYLDFKRSRQYLSVASFMCSLCWQHLCFIKSGINGTRSTYQFSQRHETEKSKRNSQNEKQRQYFAAPYTPTPYNVTPLVYLKLN